MGWRTNPNALARRCRIRNPPAHGSCLIERRAGIDILHSMTHGVIEQTRSCAPWPSPPWPCRCAPRAACRRRRARYRCVRPVRQQAAEVPQRGPPERVFGGESTLPTGESCARPKHSQEVKCFALGQAERSSAAPQRSLQREDKDRGRRLGDSFPRSAKSARDIEGQPVRLIGSPT